MAHETKTAAKLRDKDLSDEERSKAAADLARLKNQMTAPRTRRRQAAHAARTLWQRMSPEERRREMRRRRRLGIRRKKLRAIGQEDEE
jgi:hypothetical protein